jgi:ankyrin repeat protein
MFDWIFSKSKRQESLNASLLEAVNSADSGRVRQILSDGADPNYRANGELSPTLLYIASRTNHYEIVQYLVSSGAKVNTVMHEIPGLGGTALISACRGRHSEIANFLLERGASPNLQDKYGETALHGILDSEPPRGPLPEEEVGVILHIMKPLLAHGADVSLASKFGVSPLHAACRTHNKKAVKLLLESGAKVDVLTKPGMTPLMYTILPDGCSDSEIVRILLEAGANPFHKDQSGQTALARCSRNTDQKVLDCLREAMFLGTATSVPLNTVSTDGEEDDIRRAFYLQQLPEITTVGVRAIPFLRAHLSDEYEAHRRFARLALRKIDIIKFFEISAGSALDFISRVKLFSQPAIEVRTCVVQDRSAILEVILADIMTSDARGLILVDWFGSMMFDQDMTILEETRSAVPDTTFYSWDAVEGMGRILEVHLPNAMEQIRSLDAKRFIVLGPRCPQTFPADFIKERKPKIYVVHLRSNMSSLFSELSANLRWNGEASYITQVLSADDNLLSQEQREILASAVRDGNTLQASTALGITYSNL